MVVVDEEKEGQPGSAPVVEHFSATERAARGRSARAECPRSSHAGFELAPDRDPVAIPPEELAEVQVVATMLGGRWVHNPPPWD